MKKLLLVFALIASTAFPVTANKVWRVPIGATTPAWGPVNLADNVNAVIGLLPKVNLAPVGQQLSASSGSFSSGASPISPADVTNLSISITTTGRPVILNIIGDGLAPLSRCAFSAGGGTGYVFFVRGSTTVSTLSGAISDAPCSMFNHVDAVAAGTYTYKVQVGNSSSSTALINARLSAYEL